MHETNKANEPNTPEQTSRLSKNHLDDLTGSGSVDPTRLRESAKIVASSLSQMIGENPQFLACVDIARRVAPSETSVLITGESGTGKEIFAKFIHKNSKNSSGPFIAINCSAIPDNLLESEFFGHAKGAFTGALEKRVGLFEAAQNGTLFLDEIGDLSLTLQAKILRVLQERTIRRVGENHDRPINCRVISATHKNLAEEVESKRFREDLFFRLNVIPISIPPLRERPEDLLPLAEFFLEKFSTNSDSNACTFSDAAIDYLHESKWRGNIRELKNTIERAVVMCDGPQIVLSNFMPEASIGLLPDCQADSNGIDGNIFCVQHLAKLPLLEEVIHKYILYAVERNNGARDKTAKEIGIDRKTLYKRTRPERQAEYS